MNTSREQLKQDVIAEIVKAVSKLGTCKRAKVGAVLTRDGRIISTGYNGSPPGHPHCLDVGCLMEDGHCRRTTHAEANAIAFAARYGISTQGATLYVYGWITGGDVGVCSICAKLAKSAGIVHTVVIPLEIIEPYSASRRTIARDPIKDPQPFISIQRRPERMCVCGQPELHSNHTGGTEDTHPFTERETSFGQLHP